MVRSRQAPWTPKKMHPARPAEEPRAVELRRLRKALADAWWNEEPLERIVLIERQIRECLTDADGTF